MDNILIHIDYTEYAKEEKRKKTLNKPFRLPKGSSKKFGVYVKNDKGNIVIVKFGDPNMEIKRDNPERRKAYRARHNCSNPGPKWKANYWSCKMWSAKPVSKVTSSCGKPNCGSDNENSDYKLNIDIQAKSKGLWYNIQQKKKRMGKNYRPAKPGSPDRPKKDAWEKAQGDYEWDGEEIFDQNDLIQTNPELAKAESYKPAYKIKEDYQGCKFAVLDEDDQLDECFESIQDAQQYVRLENSEG